MDQFITRTEHEDIVRHLTTKVDRADALVKALREDVEMHGVALTAAHFSIRLVGRLLRPLLPDEQRELLELEARAGVTDSALAGEESREPNDGVEWRERMRQRFNAQRERGKVPPCPPPYMPAGEVAAMKDLGALFKPTTTGQGPCYDRDEMPPSML